MTTTPVTLRTTPPQEEERESVTIRFAGDSGDGMQLTGMQFTNTSAMAGNDLATFPDFPAEIRAPAGTLAGVSGFQVQFGSQEIFTPGDQPDVLIAMNPAALQKNLGAMERGSTLVLNVDTFEKRALEKVGFSGDPREDGSLDSYHVLEVPITSATMRALEDSSLSHKEKERSKNFFALGLMYWMYGRELDYTINWIEKKFAGKTPIIEANTLTLKAGYNFGETTEVFSTKYSVAQASIEPGTYRQITGNQGLAYGFIAASQISGIGLFLGSYPITPASDILHELSKHKRFGVRTFQAEDEISAIGAAIGASFGGSLAITTTSGPGLALKGEALGLAVIAELPLVVINVQRGGPSTGLPTKTEQSDLLQGFFGRNGDCPCIIVAPQSPSDCFFMAIEAARLSLRAMTPVLYLSDGYIANGAEPWKIPDVDSLPVFSAKFHEDPETYQPYIRNDELARPWARPGTPGLQHRLGGLEKADGTGNVSYDPDNHERMTQIRAQKVANVANYIPDATVFGEESGDTLLVGWGGTYGTIHAATEQLRSQGHSVSHMHLRHLNPMPKNVEATLKGFKNVIVAELNSGQLRMLLRAKFPIDIKGINKIQGQPFKISELVQKTIAIMKEG